MDGRIVHPARPFPGRAVLPLARLPRRLREQGREGKGGEAPFAVYLSPVPLPVPVRQPLPPVRAVNGVLAVHAVTP